MIFSKKKTNTMNGPVKLIEQPDLNDPVVIVSWLMDTVGLGEKVTSYLNRILASRPFCEIEPDEFFPLDGVHLDENVIQFPEAKFYAGSRKDVVIFRAVTPRFNWYLFLESFFDVAVNVCHASAVYAIGSMVSIIPHTGPREIMGNFNTPEMKLSLDSFNMNNTLNYETPPGQRPTLNSYLLWAARRKNIPAATLWVPVPFYIATSGDPRAELRILEFFNRKLDLHLGLDDLDEDVRYQNRTISRIRQESADIDNSIRKIEAGDTLSAEESQHLASHIEQSLFRKQP